MSDIASPHPLSALFSDSALYRAYASGDRLPARACRFRSLPGGGGPGLACAWRCRGRSSPPSGACGYGRAGEVGGAGRVRGGDVGGCGCGRKDSASPRGGAGWAASRADTSPLHRGIGIDIDSPVRV